MTALRIRKFTTLSNHNVAEVYEVDDDGKPLRVLRADGTWWAWGADEPLGSDGFPRRIVGTGLPGPYAWNLQRLDFL